MLRTSERGTAKRCEWAWDRTYVDELRPYTDAPALRFGSLIHRALAGWYVPGIKRGVHPREGFISAYNADQEQNQELFGMKVGDEEKWENAYDLGIAMMENYIDEYGQDSEWEVIATEMPFEVLVYHPETKEPWFLYVGVVDGVWRSRKSKKLWIPDHKTTSGIGPKTTAHLTLDDQAGAYWSWGVDYLRQKGILAPKQKLAGMLYNFMRKAMPDERPSRFVNGARMYLNKNGTVSERQPSPYFKREPVFRDEFDRNEARRRSMIDFQRLTLLRDGKLQISKNPGMFTCPMCSMRDACELHETGNDWLTFLNQTTKPWNPYSEHEIYDGR
jgi:hypothetical protein